MITLKPYTLYRLRNTLYMFGFRSYDDLISWLLDEIGVK